MLKGKNTKFKITSVPHCSDNVNKTYQPSSSEPLFIDNIIYDSINTTEITILLEIEVSNEQYTKFELKIPNNCYSFYSFIHY